MSQPQVTVGRRLPEHPRRRAAEVFDEAFGAKLEKAIPAKEKRLALVEDAFVAEHAVVAMDGDELAGLVALNSRGGEYAGGILTDDSLSFRKLVKQLGYLGAIRSAIVLQLADHKPEPGELYIDGIAVARGRGIGTRLLDEVVAIALEGSHACVRLDAIDANPRAQGLYEREGCAVTKVERFSFLRRFIGFGSVVSMELRIE